MTDTARSVSPDPTSGHGAFASWHEFYLNLMHDIAGEYVPDPDKRDRLVNDLMSAFAENESRFRTAHTGEGK